MEKSGSDHVLATPIWVKAVRGLQLLVALVILGLCARLMHDAYIDVEGLNTAVVIITFLGVAYCLLSELLPGLHSMYHIFVVLAVDALLMILWLASFAATAAKRAEFNNIVSVNSCFDSGSLVDSKTCVRKRAMMKRDVILFQSGQEMLDAVAGLGALVWLLFIATFVWTLLGFLRGRKEGRFIGSTTPAVATDNIQMDTEPKPAPVAQSYPVAPQPQIVPQYQPGVQSVSPEHQQPPYQQPPYQQDPYQQQQQQPYSQPASPYQNQPPYAPPAQYGQPGAVVAQQQYQQVYQQQQQQPAPYPQVAQLPDTPAPAPALAPAPAVSPPAGP